MSLHDYQEFLRSKAAVAKADGLPIVAGDVNPLLKLHQRAIVEWAVRGGRRAIFAAFGLGKTFMQIEALRLVLGEVGGRGLIVAPLGVRQEFMRDARKLGVPLRFIRRIEEADENGLFITNYETVRDGKLDPRLFTATSLDEASCLRGFGGTKTFREFMKLFAGDDREQGIKTEGVRYRFVATATPSPNDYIELLAYAAYLGIMDVGEAKTRFFKRDSEKADKLTLHPHKEEEFWLWVSSWAIFLQKPSDLGFDNTGYELPPLKVVYHEVQTDLLGRETERDGQGILIRDAAIGVQDAAREKRNTLDTRVEKMVEIIAAAPDDHFILWHDLEAERKAIEEAFPSTVYDAWEEFRDGHPLALELYERHYSAYQYADGRERELFCGPGFKTVLLSRERDALFAWRKFIDKSGQKGINAAVFRNEGERLSSDLIKEAMAIAWMRWPGERLYTYVHPGKTAARRSKRSQAGECFIQAGWRACGETAGGLTILEALPGAGVPSLEPRRSMASVYGTQDLEEREQAIIDFSDGKIQYLAAKPVIAGSGCNFQRHCHKAIFLGIGFKFNDFIQAVHRIQRFLQGRPVEIHIIHAESEREVLRTLQRKWRQHEHLVEKMGEIIRKYRLNEQAMAKALERSIGVERIEVSGENFTCINNDTVIEATKMAENSVGLIITSIPFSTQYEYTPSYNDFGHTDDDAHFWEQMDFLTPQLLRVLKPGRWACIHVKDRIVPGGINGFGFQTLSTFHADCIYHFKKHGFAFMGMKTIVTDVVRENSQTYRLGWTEQCKDATKMGVGVPEYLILLRKPQSDTSKSYADDRVVKPKKEWDAKNERWINDNGYSRARWQIDAHAFTRSNGDRLLTANEIAGLPASQVYRLWKSFNLETIYDFEHHVMIAEALEMRGALPPTFMLLPPHSWSDDVWSEVTRMMTLNGAQHAKGKEMHLCPLQFDIVDRAIAQLSNRGDVVFDPFGGLMTVPYRAVKHSRKGVGVELNTGYFLDGVKHCEAMEREISIPSLFDYVGIRDSSPPLSPDEIEPIDRAAAE